MTRAGAYGQSFALEHLTRGRVAEAHAAAAAAMAADGKDPEPVLDRAQIHLHERNWAAAVADIEQAVALDREAAVLDDSVIDDTAFSALVGWAQELAQGGETNSALAVLARYRQVVPEAAATHGEEAASWERRLKGGEGVWKKPQD